MPGLIRGVARTAAVVGTATATRNAVNRRQAAKNAQVYTEAMETATPQYAPSSANEDALTQLERLGALKAQGLISDDEFAVQKAKLLSKM